MTIAGKDVTRLIGRLIDSLSILERRQAAGQFAALEIYTPQTLPVRRIEAIGGSAQECVRQLAGRGLDPSHFEFVLIRPPY